MDLDRAVFVVDLRSETLREDREALDRRVELTAPEDELALDEPIDTLALLHDGTDEPLLLSITPTRDRDELDAIARLMRFAVLRGERMAKVAIEYGGELERRLAFERRLPAWAYDGIDAALPPELRVLRRPSLQR
jgi:hypothetical protein